MKQGMNIVTNWPVSYLQIQCTLAKIANILPKPEVFLCVRSEYHYPDLVYRYKLTDAEMADGKGNVVSCEPELVANLEIDPYKAFPWMYNDVYHNRVHNGVLFAFPNGGRVINNSI